MNGRQFVSDVEAALSFMSESDRLLTTVNSQDQERHLTIVGWIYSTHCCQGGVDMSIPLLSGGVDISIPLLSERVGYVHQVAMPANELGV